MKKMVILLVLFACVSLAVSAQGFYFDLGLGIGKAWTKMEGIDFNKIWEADLEISPDEIAFDINLRGGYGPIGNMPLYVVGELGRMSHKFYDDEGYITFTSYLIGPGVIFYPIPLIQAGVSIGLSFADNQSDFLFMAASKIGYAYSISSAVDLGKGDHGFLLGLKYFHAFNMVSKESLNSSYIGIFAKYAYRKKVGKPVWPIGL
ncbi:MAG: hypothetical protein LBH42_10240 [Treponema sp.]|jgi:hypothetical protein|nr:hypothetical protein [Treponema sp.]